LTVSIEIEVFTVRCGVTGAHIYVVNVENGAILLETSVEFPKKGGRYAERTALRMARKWIAENGHAEYVPERTSFYA
jgi:hypothetical protein